MKEEQPDTQSEDLSSAEISQRILVEQLEEMKRQLNAANIQLTVDKAAITVKDSQLKELQDKYDE